MKYARIIIIFLAFFMVLGAKIHLNAATSTGVFYWWSSSSSGYYGNDGVWRSWYSNPPAQPEYRYDMNSNQISWDGYSEQSRAWGGSVYYATDGHWKRRVDVTYCKPDPDTTPPAEPTFTVSNGSNGSVAVTINYSQDSAVKLFRIGSGQYQNYLGTVTLTSNNTIYAKAQDASGNWSSESSYIINNIDTTPPTGSIKINNDAQYSNTQSVTLSIRASDNNGSVSQMLVSNDSGFYGAYWETYSGTRSWIVASGDGVKNVYIKFKDIAGNESIVYSDSIILDTTPPAVPTFTVSNGSNGSVAVTINYSQDSAVKLFRIGSGQYQNYLGPVTLTSNNIVYAKAQDVAGNWSSESSYTVSGIGNWPPTGNIKINNDVQYSNSQSVTLSIVASDNNSAVSQMLVSNDSGFYGTYWETYSGIRNWTLTSGDGVKNVYIKFKDSTGNESTVYSDSIILDTIPPNAPTFSPILGTLGSATLIINYSTDSSIRQYKIGSGNYTLYFGPINIYENTVIYARAQDAAGNWSSESSYSTGNIDRTPPNGSIKINSDSAYTNTLNVTLNISASDAGSGMGQMMVSSDASFSSISWETYTTSRSFTLPSGDGTKTVYIKFKDSVGNESNTYNDTIILDTIAPSRPTFYSGIDMNGRTVLTLNYPSDASIRQYKIGNGSYQNYNDTFILSENTTVYARCQDAAGNWSEESSLNIGNIGTGDVTPPTGSIRISINYMLPGNLNATLTIYASDVGTGVSQMMIGNDVNFTGAYWEAYNTSKSWVLSPYGDVKTVYIKFKDTAGNISTVYSDTAVLSNPTLQIPSMPTVNFNPGVYYQPQWISLYSEMGTIIRYTIDGSEPTEYSMIYVSPITIYNTTIIKAKAYRNGFGSPTLLATYVIVNGNQNSYNDSLSQARNLYDSGRYSEAIDMLKRLLNNDGKNEDALLLLVECYAKQNDVYSAKNVIKQYITFYEYPRIVNRYAEICIQNRESAEARNVIEDILPKYPNEIYLYRTLAKAYEQLNFDGIKVFVYGEEVDFSRYDFVYPIIIDGRTLIPIRALSEALGAKVDWNYRLSRADIYLDDRTIEISDKSSIAKVDGTTCRLDVPARIIDDRLMVPLRFISENFGKEVNWFEIGKDASIITVTKGK